MAWLHRRQTKKGRGFYAVMAVAMALDLALNFAGISGVKMLGEAESRNRPEMFDR